MTLTLPANILVIDLETKGLERGVEILGIAWADAMENAATKWDGRTDRTHWQRVFDQHILVMHNSKFDVRVLREHGFTIRPGQYLDTQIMAYALNPTHESYALKEVARREGTALKLDYLPSGGWANAVWDDRMEEYAAADAQAEFELYHKFRTQLIEDQQALHHFLTIEMPFVEVILEMESTGFTLDLPALAELHGQLTEETTLALAKMVNTAGLVPGATVEYKTRIPIGSEPGGMTGVNVLASRPYCRLEDKPLGRMFKGEWRLADKFVMSDKDVVYDHCKVSPFNPNSGHHIATTLERLYGWEPAALTKTKQPKTDAESLEYVADEMPLAKMLVDYAEGNKVLTSFIEPFTQMHEGGILRANFNQTVTKTGRLSSSNPNLQNVPTRTELGHKVRKLVVAPPGYSIVGIDLSNIEGRVLAAYLALKMNDFGMAETFKLGVDFHQANADRWGVSRNDAKTLLFATLYGAGPLRIGKGDKKRGLALIKTLEANAPAMFELKEKSWRAAQAGGGVIHTLFGRRLVYENIIPAKALRHAKALKAGDPTGITESPDRIAHGLTARAKRQVFNALLQGTAADIMKRLTLEAMPLIRRVHGFLAAQVHDEILVYVPTVFAPWLKDELTKLFTRDDLLPHVPVTGDAKIGTSWLEVH